MTPTPVGMRCPECASQRTKVVRGVGEASLSTTAPATFILIALNVAVYLADQSYTGKGSALLPFFGEPAMTNTATSRIARVSGATVLPCFSRRLPGDSDYVLTIGAPLDGFPSRDAAEDTRRLTRVLEDCISVCPEQYWWIHKRFKNRPPPLPDLYARRRPPP